MSEKSNKETSTRKREIMFLGTVSCIFLFLNWYITSPNLEVPIIRMGTGRDRIESK